MTTPISRRYRRNSIFGDGHRVPLDRERRAVWKARIEMHRRAGRLTDGHAFVALALVRRLGTDGRLDPSHATLADGTQGNRYRPSSVPCAPCVRLAWCFGCGGWFGMAGGPRKRQTPIC
jgi:hypothetical protein